MTTLKRNESEEFGEEHGKEFCLICLLKRPSLILPCNHKACQQCLERIFLQTTTTADSFQDYRRDENIEILQDKISNNCPTRGRCPFCRSLVNMFDLKHDESDGVVEGTLVYEKNINLKDSNLNNLVFSDSSFESKSISFTDGVPELSFFNYDGNGDKQLIRKHRFDVYFYHEKSLTFSGSIQWKKDKQEKSTHTNGNYDAENDSWEGVDKWEVVVQFASDMRYTKHGAIIKLKTEERTNNDGLLRYPLDGEWLVHHIFEDKPFSINDVDFSNASNKLKVVCNKFTFCDVTYSLCFSGHDDRGDDGNGEIVYFDWPLFDDGELNVRQVVESGVDLKHHPQGPDINSVIVWDVNHKDYHRILWKRVTKGTVIPPLQIECIGGFGTKFMNEGNRFQQRNDTLSYNQSSPNGNIFIQAHKVGLASYHFVSVTGEGEEGVYISYEHEQCARWPSLDDGSPVPFRVPFVNISYDADTRTFRGKIPWMEEYGTTWQGCSEWHYVMIFDSRFTCIVSGNVSMGTNVFHDSTYGETLNYYNAAMVEMIKDGIDKDSVSGNNEDTLNIPTETQSQSNEPTASVDQNEANQNFNNVSTISEGNTSLTAESFMTYSKTLKDRLRSEGAKNRTLYLISQAAIGVLDETLNPIDYNGMNR